MAQVDKLNYIPNLLWFIIFFMLFYFLIFSYIIPLFYGALKTRELFFTQLLLDIKVSTIFEIFIKIVAQTWIMQGLLNFARKAVKNSYNFSLLRNYLKNK